MWDVNVGVFFSDVYGEVFDLNYVGCEHEENRQDHVYQHSFDLNYVGCERLYMFCSISFSISLI